jgi:hypothetical protein
MLQLKQPIRPFSSAFRTSFVVPRQLGPALRAAPAVFLISGPLLHAHFPDMAKIGQNLRMVLHSVIIEIGDAGAREILTIGATGNIRLFLSA